MIRQIIHLTILLSSLLLFSACGDDVYQAGAPSDERTSAPLPTRLHEGDVARLLVDAGFRAHEIHTMICIANYESGLRSDAIGIATHGRARGSRDIGIFQINAYFWARPRGEGGCGLTELQLLDPRANARCARMVYERHGFNGWIAYKKNRMTCQNYIADLAGAETTVALKLLALAQPRW